jgi:hypothetical protein
MPNLYEILADAQHGEAMSSLGDEFGLTPQQTQAAVAALLPAISIGLKRSTATPEGLGNLFALMAQQPDLYAAYEDPRVAFSPQARAAGNAVLSTMFGSPEASRAIAAQAQNLSGVTSAILKKLLPVIAGMIISGLMRSGSGRAASSPNATRTGRWTDRHPAADFQARTATIGADGSGGLFAMGNSSNRRHPWVQPRWDRHSAHDADATDAGAARAAGAYPHRPRRRRCTGRRCAWSDPA